jgi:hypothetical protein
MTDSLITAMTVDSFRDILQQAGYRAEKIAAPEEAPVLRSATGGLPFDVRFSNRIAGETAAFADLILLAGLRVDGDLSLSVVNDWNNTRRFARLRLFQGHLLLDMDINVLGGVSSAHLLLQLQIWDRLIQDLIVYLRENPQRLQAATAAERPPGEARPAA